MIIFGLCWNLRLLVIKEFIIITSWRILVSFRGNFFLGEDYIFCMVKYLNFHNSSFALRYFVKNVNGKATLFYIQFCYWQTTANLRTLFPFGLSAHPRCRSGLVWSGQVRSGQVRSGQVRLIKLLPFPSLHFVYLLFCLLVLALESSHSTKCLFWWT